VTLTFWRPQRKPIPPDENGGGGDACLGATPACEWVDIGGLNYAVGGGCFFDLSGDEKCGEKMCPPQAYTVPDAEKDTLAPIIFPSSEQAGGLFDRVASRGADPHNTFTYTVNLSQCLRDPRMGFAHPNAPYGWDVGQEREIFFKGTDFIDHAQQVAQFKRVQ
jgi:hypothetical protein